MQLSKDQILSALNALNRRLKELNLQGEICIFGGSAMVLAYSARVATKDVDALFHPTAEIRAAAKEVAAELDLPENWLNDAVKGFVSAHHEVTTGNLPQFPNLRVTAPVPEYLLAMKALAARIGQGVSDPDDTKDLRFLIRFLKLQTPNDVLEIVQKYYPPERISVKTQYVIDGIFEE